MSLVLHLAATHHLKCAVGHVCANFIIVLRHFILQQEARDLSEGHTVQKVMHCHACVVLQHMLQPAFVCLELLIRTSLVGFSW